MANLTAKKATRQAINESQLRDSGTQSRLNVYIDAQLHKRFKRAAVDDERSMSRIVEDMVKRYLDTRPS